MEPVEVPPHAIWRYDFEDFKPDRWHEVEPLWDALELALGDIRRFVLDAPEPFPEEERAIIGAN